MGLLFDSFWRAAAYCLNPRVMALSVLPLLLMVGAAWALGHWYWEPAVQTMRTLLESSSLLQSVLGWVQTWGGGDPSAVLAPLMVVLIATPVLVVLSLLVVALVMTPALVALVAQRRFPDLERKKGASFLASLFWSLSSSVLALVAMVLSIPLWLVPPLVLVLPPLIWGWLTYRVMAYDALAEHASKEERETIFRRHRASLLAIGLVTGYLGAAPGLVWASGVVFAAAFFILIPLAVWIYALVFAFSSLWFAHFSLLALQRLRAEPVVVPAAPWAVAVPTPLAQRPALDVSYIPSSESHPP
ncbi:MAG: EI24 domain-containing protein [Burkholderiaceae bacterium]|nr:EI24 domain-containing protein [Burkholderiaceae bacterium]